MPIKFRVISHVMLDRGAHALGLHAFDISDGDARSEPGIFAKVLKVTSVHRRAINIHAWRKEEMHAFGARISTELSPDALCQRRIPGRGQTDPGGHRGGWSKVANAHWPIRHFQTRQSQSRNASDEKPIDSSQQIDLFFEGHFAED